jgi:hypothetical protein
MQRVAHSPLVFPQETQPTKEDLQQRNIVLAEKLFIQHVFSKMREHEQQKRISELMDFVQSMDRETTELRRKHTKERKRRKEKKKKDANEEEKEKLHVAACTICLQNDATHAYTQCGHYCVCDECISQLAEKTKCPVCNVTRTAVTRIFVPLYTTE